MAGALARDEAQYRCGLTLSAESPENTSPTSPVLAIVGTARPTTLRQVAVAVAAKPQCHVVWRAGGREPIKLPHDAAVDRLALTRIVERLRAGSSPLVTFDLPSGLSEDEAAVTIDTALAEIQTVLANAQTVPGTLFVSGGRTLLSAMQAADVEWISITGCIEPGFPLGRLHGGPLAGVQLAAKSGSFGDDGALKRLLARSPCG